MKLTRCDAKAQDVKVNKEQWDAGLKVFYEVLASPSRLDLPHDDFSRDSIQKLMMTFGATGVLGFINKLPWQNLSHDTNGVVLKNSQAGANVSVNGLKLVGGTVIKMTMGANRVVTVSGLTIAGNGHGSDAELLSIDLSRPGAMQVKTSQQLISDFPVSFFSPAGAIKPINASPTEIFGALADAALDLRLAWGDKVRLTLLRSNIQAIAAAVSPLMAKNPFNETMDKVLGNTKTMILGKNGPSVASLSLKQPMTCDLEIGNIPVVGVLKTSIIFNGSGISLADLKRKNSTVVTARIVGIRAKTPLGETDVTSLEVTPEVLKIQVGPVPVSIPVNGKPGGPAMQSISCR
jgi:hypothetical protein